MSTKTEQTSPTTVAHASPAQARESATGSATTRQAIGKLVTHHDPKPIPSRRFDWSCTTENFDASWEGEETGYVANEPVGYGATEEEAKADFMEQWEEREDARDATRPIDTMDLPAAVLAKLFERTP